MTDTAPQPEQTTIRWLTPEQTRARFDAKARRVMGMSGEEFPRRYDVGEFDRIHDDGEHIEFVELEMLIPWGRWALPARVRPRKAPTHIGVCLRTIRFGLREPFVDAERLADRWTPAGGTA